MVRASKPSGKAWLERSVRAVCVVLGTTLSVKSYAQTSSSSTLASDDEVIVRGKRLPGSAILDVDPVAILDRDVMRSLAATNLKELFERLRPLSTAADGADPVTLLNGRRISSFGEIENLPPEAIERTEILPEQAAARFGFPPTIRVVNLITRKRYRGSFVQALGGTTTEGGGSTNYVELNTTRIDGPRRVSLNASHLREYPVLESQRGIVTDPGAPFAIGGNVGGLNGGSIDPALDRMAGFPVTVAAVPLDPAARKMLSAYAANANRPAVSDTGAFRSLQERRDTVHINGTLAGPVGKAMDGSINLSLDALHANRLSGLAPAMLTVPGSNGAFPFSNDVLLYRYIPEALRQQRSSVTIHGGATLQGSLGRWAWNMSSSYDRVRGLAHSQQGIDLHNLQASIDAGGDPLAPINPNDATRLIDRSRTVTGTWISKAVSNGPLLKLPAGEAQLTASFDYARSTNADEEPGRYDGSLNFSRTIRNGSVSLVVPIAAPKSGALPFLGSLSLNGMVGASDVSRYRKLTSFNYGMNWKPKDRLQLSASVNDARTAPEIDQLASPILITPNVPFFDFSSGRSLLVTTIGGGNPALAPVRRHVTTLSADVQPIRAQELRIGLDYIDTLIRDQSATLGSATPDFQAAFPGRFTRDAAGQLTSVDVRPVNLAQERERKIRTVISFATSIGRRAAPPSNSSGVAAGNTANAPSPRPRPTISLMVTATWRFEDRLTLGDALGSIDLLRGGTLTGTGGRPRWETHVNVSGSVGPLSFGALARLQGPTRITSDIAASDLRFSGRTWIVPYGSLDIAQVIKRPWARSLSVQMIVENLLNSRIQVRDRNGSTPYRFQSAFIDPLGRSVRLGVRKVF